MKGTLEKLRKIFISKRRQEDDLSASKFSRSLSFKKGSMRKSLRRLTRRKAVVTNHGIIYVEGDPNSPSTPTPPSLAAAFAVGRRPVPPAVSQVAAGGARCGAGELGGAAAVKGGDVTPGGPARDRSVTVSGMAVTAGPAASPSAGRTASGGVRSETPAASPAPARRAAGPPEPTSRQSPHLSAGGPRPASSTGNIPAGLALPRVRRPTDSLPRIPTEAGGSDEAQDGGRRASHCGAYRAVEAPHTLDLVDRTARIMSASLSSEKVNKDAAGAKSDSEDDTKPVEERATAAGKRKCEKTDVAEDQASAASEQQGAEEQTDDGSPQAGEGDADGSAGGGGSGGGGARRRLPTVTATRDHLRRSLRRLSERRRRSRRPESLADAPPAGVDFYKMFSRVPPVLAPGTSVPSTPFTFSRRNPITQWLAESEQAQQAAKKAPGSANWDSLLWSELVLTPPATEKEARRRTKRASKKANRARRSGVRTSSEASAGSVGTAASGTDLEPLVKVESGMTPQALEV